MQQDGKLQFFQFTTTPAPTTTTVTVTVNRALNNTEIVTYTNETCVEDFRHNESLTYNVTEMLSPGDETLYNVTMTLAPGDWTNYTATLRVQKF